MNRNEKTFLDQDKLVSIRKPAFLHAQVSINVTLSLPKGSYYNRAEVSNQLRSNFEVSLLKGDSDAKPTFQIPPTPPFSKGGILTSGFFSPGCTRPRFDSLKVTG